MTISQIDEGRAREPYDRVVHVIPPDATLEQAVAIFTAAWQLDRRTVGGSYDDSGIGTGLNSKRAVLHGIPLSNQDSFRAFFRQFYPSTIVEFVDLPGTAPSPTISLKVTPPHISVGQSCQVDWNVKDATSATLNGETVALIGSRTFKPTTTTTYTIRAVGNGGIATQSVTVGVTTTPPPPPVTGRVGVGVNVINGGQDADLLGSRGYEAVAPTFNPGHAARLAAMYPKMWVYVRPDSGLDIKYWREKAELDRFRGMKNVVIGSLNEGDYGLHDTTRKSIQDRANWDAACWRECQAIGTNYAGGSYSVGCPPTEQDEVAQWFREIYAPLVNGGMWWNQHSYLADDHGEPWHWTKFFEDIQSVFPSVKNRALGMSAQHAVRLNQDTTIAGLGLSFYRAFGSVPEAAQGVPFTFRRSWWTMERVRFLTLKCGFDPRLVNFCADEWLLEGSVATLPWVLSGGVNENKLTNDEFQQFIHISRNKLAEPFFFGDNGMLYPSPVKFVCVFCAYNGTKWWGYDVTHRIPLDFYKY